jgi:hypothetical protein
MSVATIAIDVAEDAEGAARCLCSELCLVLNFASLFVQDRV